MLIKNIISQRYKGTEKEKGKQFIKNYNEMIQSLKQNNL